VPDAHQDDRPRQLAEITVHRGSIERVLVEKPFSPNVIFEELMIALESESAEDDLGLSTRQDSPWEAFEGCVGPRDRPPGQFARPACVLLWKKVLPLSTAEL